jgi:hypothetical protein
MEKRKGKNNEAGPVFVGLDHRREKRVSSDFLFHARSGKYGLPPEKN